MKDDGCNVTEGRFEPATAEMQAQTNKDLLDLYLAKPKREFGTETIPIVIDDRNLKYAEACIQTEVIIDERD